MIRRIVRNLNNLLKEIAWWQENVEYDERISDYMYNEIVRRADSIVYVHDRYFDKKNGIGEPTDPP